MERKELLIELCERLEIELNRLKEDKPNSVVFFSGLKPSNYWLSNIHIGTTKTIDKNIIIAWFVEIFIDEECIFRESYIPKDNEDHKIVEGMCISRLFESIFFHGVTNAKNNLQTLIRA